MLDPVLIRISIKVLVDDAKSSILLMPDKHYSDWSVKWDVTEALFPKEEI